MIYTPFYAFLAKKTAKVDILTEEESILQIKQGNLMDSQLIEMFINCPAKESKNRLL